jgi:hypothetical protein
MQVHRIWTRRPLGAAGLGGDKLSIERVGEPCDDFVLHIKEIGHRFVETFRPEVIAALGVDKLNVDAHPAAAALNASLKHVAHA